MTKFFKILFLLFLPLFIIQCKTSKKTTQIESDITLSESELLKEITENNLVYNTLEATGTAHVKTNDFSMSGSFILRLEKDKKAWMSIRKFGLEVARLLLENDTATVISRFEKSYYQLVDKQISDLIDLDISADQIIELMAGNALLKEADLMSISQDSSTYEYAIGLDQIIGRYYYDYKYDEVFRNEYSDQSLRTVSVDFSDIEKTDSIIFAKKRTYNLKLPDLGKANINVKINKYNVDKTLSFPFEIPSHYTRAK